ncbi:MAG: hypothetical protein U0838_17690 [Chloroflexota bacterium]
MRSCAAAPPSCWGEGEYGTLGNGVALYRSTPVSVKTITNATQVSGGDDTACARLSTGKVMCWGDNWAGMLGDGTHTSRANSTTSPHYVYGITTAVSVAVGDSNGCVILTGGTVKCWGSSFDGMLGAGHNDDTAKPLAVGVTGATQLSLGGYRTACARLSNGTVKCWGRNDEGQMGLGTTDSDPHAPTTIPGLTSVTQVVAGYRHTCARISNGTVKCWGSNVTGELGDGTYAPHASPAIVPGLNGVKSLAAYGRTTCALLTSGGVKCWGAGYTGQLGNHSASESTVPVTAAVSGIAALAAGTEFMCAKRTTGSVKCWGGNDHGQAGNGTTNTAWVPATVSGLSGVLSIGGGDVAGYAVLSTHRVKAWGSQHTGQLGNGYRNISGTPTGVVVP